jgi:hypothetical protein
VTRVLGRSATLQESNICTAFDSALFDIAVDKERLDSQWSSHYDFLERQPGFAVGHRRRSRLDISSITITHAVNSVAAKAAPRKNLWATMRLPIPSLVTTYVQINGFGELHSIDRHGTFVCAGNTGP